MLIEVVPQWCSLETVTRKDLSGIGHALLFWGFSLFLISYIIFIGLAGGFGLSPVIEGTAFETVYSSILDIAAVWVIIVSNLGSHQALCRRDRKDCRSAPRQPLS